MNFRINYFLVSIIIRSPCAVASRRTRGPIDNISFGAPFWPVTNHSRSDSSLFESGFEVDSTGPGRAAFVSPRARGSCHHGSPRCPRNARLTMASVMIMFITRSKHFLQKVASVAIACSWMRLMRSLAFHRPKAMLASRCDWVFSCDLIFRPKFFGLPDTQLATLFALPMDNRTTNSFDNRASSSLSRSRVIAVLFPLPQNVHGSVFSPRKCCHCRCG